MPWKAAAAGRRRLPMSSPRCGITGGNTVLSTKLLRIGEGRGQSSIGNRRRRVVKQLRILLWGLSVCGALALALPVAADDAKGAPKFMWIDKNGERHYGDAVPPEYAQGETHTLNGQGVELQHQEGAKNAQQQVEQARRDQDAAQRAQHDRALLATYASTKDIERRRDERLDQLDGQVKAINAYIATLETRLGALQDRAMHFKPYNTKPEARKMPDDLA